jgi:hypothetical protein
MARQTIWKFPLKREGEQVIDMPKHAMVLAVQMQDTLPTLWAEVDPDGQPEKRRFRIIGTGHEFQGHGLAYIGTVQDGWMVWHVYEDCSAFREQS